MLLQAAKRFLAWLAHTDEVAIEKPTLVSVLKSEVAVEKPIPLPNVASGGPVVGIEFFNRQATKLELWIELACIEVMLEPGMEYRVESIETEYRIEFDSDRVILYLQYRFGSKVFQRPYSTNFRNPEVWELVEDYSDIE